MRYRWCQTLTQSSRKKTEDSIAALRKLARSKIEQEKMAADIAKQASEPGLKALAEALSASNRLMAEDLMREAGYMLPQSENAQRLIAKLLENQMPEDFPKAEAERLIILLKQNNK